VCPAQVLLLEATGARITLKSFFRDHAGELHVYPLTWKNITTPKKGMTHKRISRFAVLAKSDRPNIISTRL
jgi:hypothetical protein